MDTEGFVLKAKLHSAKVMDYEGIKTLLHGADTAISSPHVIFGWMPATAERRRVQTGSGRRWGGA